MTESKSIVDRTFDFALLVIEVYKFLTYQKKEYILSKQLIRSGTSIGANTEEAQAAQTKKDFAFKMTIASKEARESLYWIRLLNASGYLDGFEKKNLLFDDCQSIMRITSKIVKTSQEKLKNEAAERKKGKNSSSTQHPPLNT